MQDPNILIVAVPFRYSNLCYKSSDCMYPSFPLLKYDISRWLILEDIACAMPKNLEPKCENSSTATKFGIWKFMPFLTPLLCRRTMKTIIRSVTQRSPVHLTLKTFQFRTRFLWCSSRDVGIHRSLSAHTRVL